ncbi:three-Cys-motif partner protein TcmP [Lewinella sp. W8]|uniref:three-Cys-motif partner protein TcmP n=1 Tax=Lewinella sp. W8 TaxID=2528208 RepID=UPI001068D1E2|nr:three-Cys-motif partner protein TcmP [Lewinella sp. W8]MTB52786.1 three-Cys-motif partner protein TcmP [Lewinella sp. W8]
MSKFDPIIDVEEDGLLTPTVRRWSEEKYSLLGSYANIFTTSMCKKWNQLVYLDLFAGAGYARIKSTNRLVMSSSLIALSLPVPFTKYILCEENKEKFDALKTRVSRDFPAADVTLIHGDVNKKVWEVKRSIPRYGKGNTLLSFSFVDPFSLNLDFNTIKVLGSRMNMDFLILLALGMDANRNFKSYLLNNSSKVAKFIDDDFWTKKTENLINSSDFMRFLSSTYDDNMLKLGYKEAADKQIVRSHVKNLSLYHLAFYSKHDLGNQFWNDMRKYTDKQISLF